MLIWETLVVRNRARNQPKASDRWSIQKDPASYVRSIHTVEYRLDFIPAQPHCRATGIGDDFYHTWYATST